MGSAEIVLNGLDDVALDILFLLEGKEVAGDYLPVLVVRKALWGLGLGLGLNLVGEAEAACSCKCSHEVVASLQHSPPNKTIYIICWLYSKRSGAVAPASLERRNSDSYPANSGRWWM